MRTNDVILRTAVKVIVIIIIIFSLFLLFAGHNNPGGGFIGGLLMASALVLLTIAFDLRTIRQMIPINFRVLTATGLLIALLTGAGSFVFGAPFLKHVYTYVQLPLLGKTAFHTAVLFDIGVYVAVVGVTMTILLTIGEDE
jgi:monovalent cation:proton antiporter